MISKCILWFKKLFLIVKDYDSDMIKAYDMIRACELKVSDGVNIIKERTDIHADIHLGNRNESQVIMVGRYNGRDYIQTFNLNDDDFGEIISRLRGMEKYGVVRRVDAVPGLKACIEQDLEYWRN